jgi:hypothetical protein
MAAPVGRRSRWVLKSGGLASAPTHCNWPAMQLGRRSGPRRRRRKPMTRSGPRRRMRRTKMRRRPRGYRPPAPRCCIVSRHRPIMTPNFSADRPHIHPPPPRVRSPSARRRLRRRPTRAGGRASADPPRAETRASKQQVERVRPARHARRTPRRDTAERRPADNDVASARSSLREDRDAYRSSDWRRDWAADDNAPAARSWERWQERDAERESSWRGSNRYD